RAGLLGHEYPAVGRMGRRGGAEKFARDEALGEAGRQQRRERGTCRRDAEQHGGADAQVATTLIAHDRAEPSANVPESRRGRYSGGPRTRYKWVMHALVLLGGI